MSTSTDWVWLASTAATLTIATPISAPQITGPGDAIEQIVQDVSLAFDLDEEMGPWFAASEETLELLWNLQ